MTDINLKHTSISNLLEPRVEGPYTRDGYLRKGYRQVPLPRAELDKLKEASRLSIPVYGEPYLVGYVFDRISRGLTELEPETLPYNVKRAEGTAIKEYIAAFGGAILTIGSKRGMNDFMQIGRYIVDWDWGTQVFGQDYGPDAGPMTVHQFDTSEEAIERVGQISEAYAALQGARKALAAVRL